MSSTVKDRSLSALSPAATATSDAATITELELMLLLQPDADQPWIYSTHEVRHRPVTDRDHARQLILAVDEIDTPYVILETADGNTFAQVGDKEIGVIVEVNSVPDFVQRVVKGGAGHQLATAAQLSTEEDVTADELHTNEEAVNLCFAWMEQRRIPAGYFLRNLAR